MRIDVVVTLVKEHRDATAVFATMFDDPLGERLDCTALNATSTLKEGTDAADWIIAGVITVGAGDVLAVLEHAVVVHLSDLLAEGLCYGVLEKDAVG